MWLEEIEDLGKRDLRAISVAAHADAFDKEADGS
jgi:hypothetical protein